MSTPRWSSTFLASTPTADQEASGFPVTRIASLHPHPLSRYWSGNNGSEQNVFLSLSAPAAIQGIALLGINFTFQLAHAATLGGSYTVLPGSNFVPSKFLDYYNCITIQNFTNQHIRIRIPAQTYLVGSTPRIGYVAIMSTVNTWPRDLPYPLSYSLQQAIVQSGVDTGVRGPNMYTVDWGAMFGHSEVSQIQEMMTLPADETFLFYENAGDVGQVALLRRGPSVSFTREGGRQIWSPTLIGQI